MLGFGGGGFSPQSRDTSVPPGLILGVYPVSLKSGYHVITRLYVLYPTTLKHSTLHLAMLAKIKVARNVATQGSFESSGGGK